MMLAPRYQRLIALACLAAFALPSASLAQDKKKVARDWVIRACQTTEKYIADKMRETGVPGLAIAVVHNGDVVYSKGFGRRSATSSHSVDALTVFQLASMSKPISSTVIAKLVSDGAVTWDSLIKDLDPSFELNDLKRLETLTVKDLYSHHSGLQGNAGNDLEEIGYDRKEILRRLRYAPPNKLTYDYSNFGMTEGAVAAAKKSNKTWETLASDFFKKMRMTDTNATYAGFLSEGNRAALHVKVEGKWFPLATRQPDAQSPAGGISSNVVDIAKWIRLQLADGFYEGEQLISRAALDETHKPLNPAREGAAYGLGWMIDDRDSGPYGKLRRWSHAGAFAVGARTVVTLLPEQSIGIVVLTNAFPTGLPDAVIDTLFDNAFIGRSDTDWLKVWDERYDRFEKANEAQIKKYTPPTKPSPPLPLAAYVATYSNDYFGKMTVTIVGDGLAIEMGPKKKSYFLTHFDADTFVYYGAPEDPRVPYGIKFVRSSDNITGLQLLDGDVTGVEVLKRG